MKVNKIFGNNNSDLDNIYPKPGNPANKQVVQPIRKKIKNVDDTKKGKLDIII